MAQAPLIVDEPSTTAMVNAFVACQNECATIAGTVLRIQGDLNQSWKSDTASKAFQNAINEWMDGFQGVRRGLDLLNDNMNTYANLTTAIEDTVTAEAGSWARG
ncbi:WXG100 family type VII secretion target [Micromonospora sp. DT233]|uniref:WXG100 family type VII secretion target n=1 Tax=Micromonospora sp. DT233 TaxID=3393432 RepID=UPI003CF16417